MRSFECIDRGRDGRGKKVYRAERNVVPTEKPNVWRAVYDLNEETIDGSWVVVMRFTDERFAKWIEGGRFECYPLVSGRRAKLVHYAVNEHDSELVDVFFDLEHIGQVSGKDVPYITSRSLDEIVAGRVEAFAERRAAERGDKIVFGETSQAGYKGCIDRTHRVLVNQLKNHSALGEY